MKIEYAAVWLDINGHTNEISEWSEEKDVSTINGQLPDGYFVREVDPEDDYKWEPKYERRR